jgi:Type VI secretion system effector, Hcp
VRPSFSVLRGRGREHRGMPTSKLARFISLFGGGLLAVLLMLSIDKASPQLFDHTTGGKHYDEVVLSAAGSALARHSDKYSKEDGTFYLGIKMEHVLVSS